MSLSNLMGKNRRVIAIWKLGERISMVYSEEMRPACTYQCGYGRPWAMHLLNCNLLFQLCFCYCDKNPWSKAPWKEKVYFVCPSMPQSNTERSQGRRSRKDQGCRTWGRGYGRNTAYWLAPEGFLCLLSYALRLNCAGMVWPLVGWGLHIHPQSRKCSTDMPTDQSYDVGNSLV